MYPVELPGNSEQTWKDKKIMQVVVGKLLGVPQLQSVFTASLEAELRAASEEYFRSLPRSRVRTPEDLVRNIEQQKGLEIDKCRSSGYQLRSVSHQADRIAGFSPNLECFWPRSRTKLLERS